MKTYQIESLNPSSPNAENQIVNAKSLKILSWNIYMLPYLSLFNGNGGRAKAIAGRLKDSDYHIIVFQEAFSYKCRNILSKRLQKEYPYQYGPVNKCIVPFRTNSGLWVISKIPLTQLDKIRFSQNKGFDVIARKGAMLLQGDFQGSRFQLLTTHLQADNVHRIREKQCREIKDHLLNQYFNPDIPQLICGDFNIDMYDHVNYQIMLHTLEAKNGKISGDVQFTYDEIGNTMMQNIVGKKSLIDYILVRNEKWINHIERKIETFYATIGQETANLSDHYAMEAHINFNDSPISDSLLVTTSL